MYVMPTGEHGLWVGDDTGKDRARVMVTADNQTKVVLDGGQKSGSVSSRVERSDTAGSSRQ